MNHIADANKMVSDTPRTDEAYFKNSATMYDLAGEMKQIERELNVANEKIEVLLIADCERLRIEEELNAANDRIKRLEEAGDEIEMILLQYASRVELPRTMAIEQSDLSKRLCVNWRKAKDDKP